MSSFEAQAALLGQAAGARRPSAINPNPQQAVIPVAQLTAPPVGAIAPFVAPTLDTRAASDLELAMQVVSQVGTAFQQLGQLGRMDYAERERADMRNAAMFLLDDTASFKQRLMKGEEQDALDSMSADEYAAAGIGGRTGQFSTEAVADIYNQRIAQMRSNAWLDRATERQKQSINTFIAGTMAQISNPDLAPPDRDSIIADLGGLGVDATQANAMLLKMTDTAADAGDSQAFDRLRFMVQDTPEWQFSGPETTQKLQRSIFAQAQQRRQVFAQGLTAIIDGPGTMAEKTASVSDLSFSTSKGKSEEIGFSMQGIDNLANSASTLAQLNQIENEIGRYVDPQTLDRMRGIIAKHGGQVAKAELGNIAATATVSSPDAVASYRATRENAVNLGISALDLRQADNLYVNTMQQSRLTVALSAVSAIGDPTDVIAELDRLAATYDPTKPEWEQVDSSISPQELSDLFRAIGDGGRRVQTQRELSDYLSRKISISPQSEKHKDMMTAYGALDNNGDLRPIQATQYVLRGQALPGYMVDRMLDGLAQPGSQLFDTSVETLARLAPLLTKRPDLVINIGPTDGDPNGNATTIELFRHVLPGLASIVADTAPDGSMSPEQLTSASNFVRSRLESFQPRSLPLNEQAITNAFALAGIGSVGGQSVRPPQSTRPAFREIESAIFTTIAERLSSEGLPTDYVATQATELTRSYLNSLNTMNGVFVPSTYEDDIEAHTQDWISGQTVLTQDNRVIGSWSKQFAAWDEKAQSALNAITANNTVTLVIPTEVAGEYNVLTTKGFEHIVIPQPKAMTREEQIQDSIERFRKRAQEVYRTPQTLMEAISPDLPGASARVKAQY